MNLEQIKADNTALNQLNIYSHEGGIYTLEAIVDGQAYPLELTPKSSVTFNCIDAIRDRLQGVSIDQVFLVQKTPYDEMIGMPTTTEPESLRIHW